MWTVDTINTFNPVYRLWGSSPTDVWAITTGMGYEDIYHFDGYKWTTGKYLILGPYSIYGFSSNNIYIGAEQGKIWKFNGSNWYKFASLTKDGNDWIVFDNIWGESSNDFYAFGAYPDEKGYRNNSVIAHFINGRWEMLNTNGLVGMVEKLFKSKDDGMLYMQVIKIGGADHVDSTIIYEYNHGIYKRLYSTAWSKTWANIGLINNNVYFILEDKIAKRSNNQFHTVLSVDNSNFYHHIWGRNSKDIFLEMTDGLAHYNGCNIEYLLNFNKPRTQIWGAALFDDEVFFLVTCPGFNFIYHGKLKEADNQKK